MRKQVYISADYAPDSGDRNVVNILNYWGSDDVHKVDFVDMAKVVSGSVSNDEDCRPCDLKREFNKQINASSVAIFIVGDKTAERTAGSACYRHNNIGCLCTPYKQNGNGQKECKVYYTTSVGYDDDVGEINTYSYLRHEFEQAKKKKKTIIILYNSLRNEQNWLPTYMKGYENCAMPFWKYDSNWNKVGNYNKIKEVLGYE